ncbi:hypothetical protein Tco_1500579 [Tanacetum coccineum]
MEECYKMLTDQINWANPEGDQVRIDVSRPLPLGGPPGHCQSKFRLMKCAPMTKVPLMVFLTGGSIDISSILRDMILRHIKEKSENTCRFSVSSESKPIQDTGIPTVAAAGQRHVNSQPHAHTSNS